MKDEITQIKCKKTTFLPFVFFDFTTLHMCCRTDEYHERSRVIWLSFVAMSTSTCSKSAVRNLHQVCSSQLAAGLQFATCSKPAVRKLHQVCSSQLASSLQFPTCIKSAVRNLHQVCSSQLASSLLTTCSRLDIIKPEQAMRTHPDIALMIASCNKPAADLLQLVRFWLCSVIYNLYGVYMNPDWVTVGIELIPFPLKT